MNFMELLIMLKSTAARSKKIAKTGEKACQDCLPDVKSDKFKAWTVDEKYETMI